MTIEKTPHEQEPKTRRAIQQCAEWLAVCRRLGWRHGDLDFLEALWWKYHDNRGELFPPGVSREGVLTNG